MSGLILDGLLHLVKQKGEPSKKEKEIRSKKKIN